MIRIALLLLALVALSAQRDPVLVPEVSQHKIELQQGFTGTTLLLFGAVLAPEGRRRPWTSISPSPISRSMDW